MDAFNAAEYLRARAQVGGKPIGVIGFSHGGWAVLKAVLADTVRQAGAKPFAAAVALLSGLRSAKFVTSNRHADPDRRSRRLDPG
jgi:dienelactone hydrolase